MSDAIDRAARAEAARKGRDEYWCGDPDVFAAGAEWAVAHLRESGLLAPAPLREEWAIAIFRGRDTPLTDSCRNREHAESRAAGKWRPAHRWTTDWFPADAVNRAEGDGRAITHE